MYFGYIMTWGNAYNLKLKKKKTRHKVLKYDMTQIFKTTSKALEIKMAE